MELFQFTEEQLKLIRNLFSDPLKGEDDIFAMALKLHQEGRIITLRVE